MLCYYYKSISVVIKISYLLTCHLHEFINSIKVEKNLTLIVIP